jgi:hypothetical protein
MNINFYVKKKENKKKSLLSHSEMNKKNYAIEIETISGDGKMIELAYWCS